MSAGLCTKFWAGKVIMRIYLNSSRTTVSSAWCKKELGLDNILRYYAFSGRWEHTEVSMKQLEEHINSPHCQGYEYVTLEEWHLYQLEMLPKQL